MSLPVFDEQTEALAPELSGNPHDDDGQIIDDLFEPTSGPADVEAAKADFKDHTGVAPKRPTRVLSGFQIITSALVQPFQILPFDANRERVVVRVYSATTTDYALVGDESNKLQSPGTSSGSSGRVYAGGDVTLEGHNGPVFIGFGAGTTVVVSWWAVTS